MVAVLRDGRAGALETLLIDTGYLILYGNYARPHTSLKFLLSASGFCYAPKSLTSINHMGIVPLFPLPRLSHDENYCSYKVCGPQFVSCSTISSSPWFPDCDPFLYGFQISGPPRLSNLDRYILNTI